MEEREEDEATAGPELAAVSAPASNEDIEHRGESREETGRRERQQSGRIGEQREKEEVGLTQPVWYIDRDRDRDPDRATAVTVERLTAAVPQ
jgi:hypothetical protein